MSGWMSSENYLRLSWVSKIILLTVHKNYLFYISNFYVLNIFDMFLRILCAFILTMCSLNSSFAMDGVSSWEDMRIELWVSQEGDIVVTGTVNEELITWYRTYFDLELWGKTFHKFFRNDSFEDTYSVSIDTGIDADTSNISYRISIQNSQLRELYVIDWVINSSNMWEETASSLSDANTIYSQVHNSDMLPWNFSQTSNSESYTVTNPTAIPSVPSVTWNPWNEQTMILSQEENVQENVSSEDSLKSIQGNGTWSISTEAIPEDLLDFFEIMENYESTENINEAPEVYIPKYKTQAEEPSNINGIGNSKGYKSWRIQN